MTPEPISARQMAAGADEYPLSLGEVVHDRKKLFEEANASEDAVVVAVADEDVFEKTFYSREHGREIPLAEYGTNDLYADYSHSERAVDVVWSEWLDSHMDGWRGSDDPATRIEFIEGMVERGVSIESASYSYPEARLVPDRYVHGRQRD